MYPCNLCVLTAPYDDDIKKKRRNFCDVDFLRFNYPVVVAFNDDHAGVHTQLPKKSQLFTMHNENISLEHHIGWSLPLNEALIQSGIECLNPGEIELCNRSLKVILGKFYVHRFRASGISYLQNHHQPYSCVFLVTASTKGE